MNKKQHRQMMIATVVAGCIANTANVNTTIENNPNENANKIMVDQAVDIVNRIIERCEK